LPAGLVLKNAEQMAVTSIEKLHQLGGETEFPVIFGFVPWRHHVEIITKCKSIEEALFYIKQTIKEGWSRNALINSIKADYYGKAGDAITNFDRQLTSVQSKLAQEITKENYDLGFVSLPPEYNEDELEAALEHNITRFLLELGTGFAFVGRQKIYDVIEKSEYGNRISVAYNYFMLVVIAVSLVPLFFKQDNLGFKIIDKVTMVIFIIDYILRLVTSDYKLKKGKISFIIYPFTFMAIIDLLSILPSLSIISRGFKTLRVLRMI